MKDRSILENKTIGDLRYIARMLGLKGFSRLKKQELIDLIVNSGEESTSVSEADKDEIKAGWEIDREFVPNMSEDRRASLLKGWEKAVKCALTWAE